MNTRNTSPVNKVRIKVISTRHPVTGREMNDLRGAIEYIRRTGGYYDGVAIYCYAGPLKGKHNLYRLTKDGLKRYAQYAPFNAKPIPVQVGA